MARASGYACDQLGLAAGLWVAVGSFSLGAQPATADGCSGGTESDFNGDGIRDIAVADPLATVDGQAEAGLVRVVLGGGKGVSELSQALSGMSAEPEAGDKFGYSIAAYDADQDGCTDLAVGVPYEDLTSADESQIDAGAVYVIHGTPSGIGAGSPVDGYAQTTLDDTAAVEAGDLFGLALAAGDTSGGDAFLTIGVPGQDVGSAQDAGAIHYMRGASRATVHEGAPGVPGVAEAHDRFGYALAATSSYIAVGSPGEAVGGKSFAGGVTLFQHAFSDGRPTALGALDEDRDDLVSGVAEAGDRFGTALSMIPYRSSDAMDETDALLAVGAPNEDVGDAADAGAVTVVRIEPSGAVSEANLVDRLAAGVEGEPAASAFFGQRVALADTSSEGASTASTVKLAVSVPNQQVGAAQYAGAVHVLPGVGAPGSGDRILTRGDGVLPDAAEARDFTGMGLWATSTDLYVGVPHSKTAGASKGVVYVAPWSLIGGGTGTVRTLKPGADGIPDEGKGFGSVIR
ncbi:VCBS repeat-containing protein [Streptomyces sp. NPDC046862]|uniref:VCBS repeat-containing protein n=1 Tax=Streptomyces sp. NPDC046862 TaxID=3154603 RepID=UPI0034544152